MSTSKYSQNRSQSQFKKNGYSKSVATESKHNESDNNSEQSLTRIWVCSWNMAAKDHFKFKTTYDGKKIPDDHQTQKFEQIIPTNYDLYIFGIQEGVSDTFFTYISLYLKEFDVQRILLTSDGKNDDIDSNKKTKKSLNKNANCFGVHGRGDGSFLNTKFTGIAMYYRRSLSPYISLKAQSAVSCGITQGSKGAACILLKIYSTTIAFLSTHMSSNSTDAKLEHFKILVNKSGDTLGCGGFDLLQQFHHIVWFGDLNYRITSLTADNVLQKMALGNLQSLWSADSLKRELKGRKKCAFKNFKEPRPRLDFYPTYKKKPNRQLDFDQNPLELRNMSASAQQSSLSQLDKIYTTKYKEPFYKGGLIQDRIPSFCDRVLYHALDKYLDGSLYPEPDTGVLNCVEFSYKKQKCNNYGCIPHHLMGSDHSAIYCGLQLKSPMLFPCPPHELNDQGFPKSYQLKIEDIKILKKSPYHSDSTYSEFPIKTKICFPAPYEIENIKYQHHKPFSYTILQQDLEMYHSILRQIDQESKRRLSQQRGVREVHQNMNRTKKQNYTKDIKLMTPQISNKRQPLNLMDPEDDITNQDTLMNAKPVVDKGLRSKKHKRDSSERDSDDDWGDSMPTVDVLTNVEDENQYENPLYNKPENVAKPKEIRANSITSLQSKRKSNTKSQTKKSQKPQLKHQKSPNRMMNNNTNHNNMNNMNNNNNNNNEDTSDSEIFPDFEPDDNHQNNHNNDNPLRSEESMEIEKQQINDAKKTKNNNLKKTRRAQYQFRKKTAPTKRLPLNNKNRSPSPNPNKKPLPKGPPPQPPQKKRNVPSSAPTTPAKSAKSGMQIKPKNSYTSPANPMSTNGDNGGFAFSFDYGNNHTFNLSKSKDNHNNTKNGGGHKEMDFFKVSENENPKQIPPSSSSSSSLDKNGRNRRNYKGGIKHDNPLSEFLVSSDEEDILDALDRHDSDKKNIANSSSKSNSNSNSNSKSNLSSIQNDHDWMKLPESMDLEQMKSSPTPIQTVLEKQEKHNITKQRPLNSSIRDDYFDAKNEDINDKVPPIINANNSTSNSYIYNDIELQLNKDNKNRRSSLSSNAMLQRTRSKSMGSFAEISDITGNKNKMLSPSPHHQQHQQHSIGDEIQHIQHGITRSGDMSHSGELLLEHSISSPIYKDLAEMSKKLTMITFGPSRRPTHGNIHCVIKVETNDFKGQTCIPFKWDDFAKEVEATQFAELFHHGIPLYDKTGSPIQCKIHYKLSLIDKQIVFDYH